MARSAVLLGRTTADLVRNVLIIGLMVAVGYLVGFRFQAGVVPALACVALVAAFGFALSWIFAFVSLVVRGAENRSDGRVRAAVSARLREFGVRPRLEPAELARTNRQSLAGVADRERGAHPRTDRRRAASALGRARVDRRNRRPLRAALSLALTGG